MIIVRLKSGMGNQMFQYAFAKRMALEIGTTVKFDLTALLDRSRGSDFVYRNFDLDIFRARLEFTNSPKLLRQLAKLKSSRITKFFRERTKQGRHYIKEEGFNYQSEIISNKVDNAVYEGWFQSYKYLAGIEAEIRADFAFSNDFLDSSSVLLQEIVGSNSVCLNVRRTDFVLNENLNVTNLEYFKQGAEILANKVDQAKFFVFSDDVEWCQRNLNLPFSMQIVDHSHKGYKFGNYLQLMSNCKHFLIPNSSFAWWATWLSKSKDKTVVAPKNWFNNPSIDTSEVCPPDWIRI